jgi:two-component system sensor histidine kinase YesM
LVLVVPLAGAAVYVYQTTTRDALRRQEDDLVQSLYQIRENIHQKIAIMETISRLVVNDRSLQRFLAADVPFDTDRLLEYAFTVAPSIDRFKAQNSFIREVRLYTDAGGLPEHWPIFFELDRLESQGWYAGELPGNGRDAWRIHSGDEIAEQSNSPNLGIPMLSLYKTLYSYGSLEELAVLQIAIPLGTFFDSYHAPTAATRETLFVLDNRRMVIAGEGTDAPVYRGESGGANHPLNSEDWLSAEIPISTIDATLASAIPASEVRADLRRASRPIVAVFIGSALILAAIIFIVTNVLLRRLRLLNSAMSTVFQGGGEHQVPEEGEDEFGQLAANFNRMVGRIDHLIEEVYEKELLERNAELLALQAQINPHFLYNTLATVSYLARMRGAPEIHSIAKNLGKFYRHVLNKGDIWTTVEDEVSHVKSYLEIQSLRYEKLSVNYRIDPNVRRLEVLNMIMQPLVENALIHGIEDKRNGGSIGLTVLQRENMIYIEVSDDGVGFRASALTGDSGLEPGRASPYGSGLSNVRERVRGYYGAEYDIDICSEAGCGTTVSITLPRIDLSEGEEECTESLLSKTNESKERDSQNLSTGADMA